MFNFFKNKEDKPVIEVQPIDMKVLEKEIADEVTDRVLTLHIETALDNFCFGEENIARARELVTKLNEDKNYKPDRQDKALNIIEPMSFGSRFRLKRATISDLVERIKDDTRNRS